MAAYNHIILLLFCVSTESAKILAFFPTPSISHQVVFRPIVQELLKRGHEIVLVTTDASYPRGKTPINLTEIEIHDASYATWQDLVTISTGSNDDWEVQLKVGFYKLAKIFVTQLETEEVKHILKHNQFDLLMVEACVRATLALSHVYKVPVIQVSSFGAVFGSYEILGAPVHPILYPSLMRQRSYNLTMWEKMIELYKFYKLEHYYLNDLEEIENVMLREYFGPDIPPLSELKNNVHMLFLNIHRLWDDNRPVPPSIVHMGGIHEKPIKDLPSDLKTFLDASKNGVIYISFGTNAIPSQLPAEKIQMLVNVFSQLPYEVLWKWDKDELPGRTANIRISKWLPQSDLLRHPKIKLFITQGGLQSTDEAINAGVPLLAIPLLGDQWYNAEKYIRYSIGKKVEMGTLKEDELKSAIESIIGEESYRHNIAKLRSIMHDQPQSGLDRAVWWTEHVLRHGGGKHLRAPAANMPWREYLDADLFLLLGLAVVSSLIVFIMSIVFLWQTVTKFLRAKAKKYD